MNKKQTSTNDKSASPALAVVAVSLLPCPFCGGTQELMAQPEQYSGDQAQESAGRKRTVAFGACCDAGHDAGHFARAKS